MIVKVTDDEPHAVSSQLLRLQQLATLRAPVLEPLRTEPLLSEHGTITVWPVAGVSADPYGDLAQALGGLHRSSRDLRGPSPERDNLRRHLRDLGDFGVPVSVHQQLLDLAAELPDDPSWGDGQLLHGDAHPGNVVILKGAPVLIDLSPGAYGPAQLDWVPAWCDGRRREGGWRRWELFRNRYTGETDPRTLNEWEHLDEAVLERELITTVFLARQWLRLPWVEREVKRRLEGWNEPAQGERWNTGT